MAGEYLDLSSDPDDSGSPGQPASKRYVGIHFTCCGVYSRIYLNRDGSAYVGNCPRCSKRVRLRVGPEGTDSRFFTAN